jgi:hypothetical protein
MNPKNKTNEVSTRRMMKKAVYDEVTNRPTVQPSFASRMLALMERATQVGVDILLPLDSIPLSLDGELLPFSGPATERRNAQAINTARTIIWNGPLGQIEMPFYRASTTDAMVRVCNATNNGVTTVVIGEDTVTRVFEAKGCLNKVSAWSSWSWPAWTLILDKKLVGIDTLSTRVDGVLIDHQLGIAVLVIVLLLYIFIVIAMHGSCVVVWKMINIYFLCAPCAHRSTQHSFLFPEEEVPVKRGRPRRAEPKPFGLPPLPLFVCMHGREWFWLSENWI